MARGAVQRGENLARGNNYTDAEGFEMREGTNIDQEALHKTWERFCGPGNVKSVTDLRAEGKYFSILYNQKCYFKYQMDLSLIYVYSISLYTIPDIRRVCNSFRSDLETSDPNDVDFMVLCIL